MRESDTRFQEARRLEDTGHEDEARSIYEDMVAKAEDPSPALNRLGVLAARRGEREEAERFFNRSLAADAQNASALSNLGNLFFEKGELDQAETYYRLAIETDPKAALPHRNLAALLKKRNDISGMAKEMKTYNRLRRHEVNNPGGGAIPRPSLAGCGAQIVVIGALIAVAVLLVHLA